MTEPLELESARERYFRLVCEQLSVRPNARGEIYVPCPQCGKSGKHFNISIRGCFCFHCGYKPLFKELLSAWNGGLPESVQVVPDRRKAPRWKKVANDLAWGFAQHPALIQAWQAYKPLPEPVIRERSLGYGVFPNLWHSKGQGTPNWVDPQGNPHWQCDHPRLIVPLFCQGQVVGFRCRGVGCSCPRWLSPGGSRLVLYNGGRIAASSLEDLIGDAPGLALGEIWIVENPIDALLIESYWGLAAVATLGVSIWKRIWTQRLCELHPPLTVVGYDHDASGIAGGEPIRLDWQTHHPGLPMPMRGNKLHALLARQRLNTILYPWAEDDPLGLDLGELFMGSPDQTEKLARFFVREYLQRDWELSDFRGPIMKHAKNLLTRYTSDVLGGAIEALRDNVIGDGYQIKYLSALESTGEPPLLQQWTNYCEEEPPVYLETTYAEWLQRKAKTYPELAANPNATPRKPARKRPAKVKAEQIKLAVE